MGEAAVANTSQTDQTPAAPQLINPDIAPKGSEGSEKINQDAGREKFDGPVLFDDEVVSKEKLSGQSDEEKSKADEEKVAQQQETDKAEAEKPKEEAKEAAADKPPKGFVPIGALHEERQMRKRTSEENAILTGRLNSALKQLEAIGKPAGTPEKVSKFENFKVLTDAEYDELWDDDPKAAGRYVKDLSEFKEYQANKELVTSAVDNVCRGAYQEIQQELPDIADIHDELIEFAAELGFPKDYIRPLTNPYTRVIDKGTGQEFILGPAASGMVIMLAKAMRGMKGQSTDAKAIEEKLTKELTPKIAAQIMEKIKTDSGSTFRNIDNLPSSGDAPTSSKGPISETDYARMSQEEKRAFLGG